MDATLYQRAQRIFDDVCDLPAAQRPRAVREACGEEPALQALVHELLLHDTDTREGAFSEVVEAAQRRVVEGPTPLEPGMVVERYAVERLLGRGGTAQVWQVRHLTLDTRFALKVLTWETPAMHRRLLREARSQAAIDHPNVVPVLDILQCNATPALLMPLVRGPTLGALLAEYTPDRDEALALVRAMSAAVAAAHDRGLCHRDLKPGNVMLDVQAGQVVPRVVDFGLVRDTREHTLTLPGMVMGSPGYAAPEQLSAQRSDHRADLWALGSLLYELLVGRRPFAGASVDRLLAAQERGPDLEPVPKDLRPLVAELLQVDPEDRLSDARELLRRLPTAPPLTLDGPLGRAVVALSLDDGDDRSISNQMDGSSDVVAPPAPGRRGWRVAAGLLALGLSSALALTLRRPEPTAVSAPAPLETAAVSPAPPAPAPAVAGVAEQTSAAKEKEEPETSAPTARPRRQAAPAEPGAAPAVTVEPARVVVEGTAEQVRLISSTGKVLSPGLVEPGDYTFEAVLPTRGNLVREPLGTLAPGAVLTVRCNDAFGHCTVGAEGSRPSAAPEAPVGPTPGP